jgi:MFS family permease
VTVKIAKLPLWLIALGTGSAVMGITLITPALPIVAEELEVSAEKVQQLLTIYLFFLAIGQLIVGP